MTNLYEIKFFKNVILMQGLVVKQFLDLLINFPTYIPRVFFSPLQAHFVATAASMVSRHYRAHVSLAGSITRCGWTI